MMDPILSMLGICRKAGKIQPGEEPVDAAVRARDARLLLLAADAADNTARRCARFAEVGQCLWLRIPESKYELGRALGRGSCAILAITDTGLALAVAQRLAEQDPGKYGEAAAKLAVKAQRARERQAEQLRHGKNLRRGKRRVKPAPEDAPPQRREDRSPFPGGRPAGPDKGPAGPGGPRKGPGRPGGPGKAYAKGPRKDHGGRGPDCRPSQKERRHAAANARYASARPVKRGKGSKPTGGKDSGGRRPTGKARTQINIEIPPSSGQGCNEVASFGYGKIQSA